MRFILGSLTGFLIMLVLSCSKSRTMAAQPAETNAGKTFLALGDSYTIGEGVAINDRFPHLTVAKLAAENILFSSPRYVATTGWTTAELLAAIQAQGISGTFDMVTLLIGVNDQYRGLDTAGYRTRFTQLLDKALGFAANRTSRVFVLSIPDYSATPFVQPDKKDQVSRGIDAFNAINREITNRYGITYIDITPLSRAAAGDPSLLAGDGLHYSRKEHALWAELLAAEIKKAL
jgi:lysophospholipase L1-like esterase